MAQITTTVACYLDEPVQVQYVKGNVFSQDNMANIIKVAVFDTKGGSAASLSGTISANVIRPDGGTVAVSGSSSGNVATVTLPQAAYAIPGTISIIIKNTVSSTVTTIGALVAVVYRSTTDTAIDPGTIIPDIQSLIADIDAAVASIPADYSTLWTSLAPAYSDTKTYAARELCTYDGAVYKAKQDILSSESWNAAHWEAVSLGDEVGKQRWYTRVSNNLFWLTNQNTRTISDVTITPRGMDTVHLSGTASANINMRAFGDTSKNGTSLPAGTYYVNFEVLSGSYTGGSVSFRFGSNETTWAVGVHTSTNAGTLAARLASGVTFTNCVIRFWVVASDTAVPYEPYGKLFAIDDQARDDLEDLSGFVHHTVNYEIIDNMTLGLAIGSYKGADGTGNTENTYAKTTLKIPDYVTEIRTNVGYSMRLYAWNKDTGVYTGLLLSTGVIAPLPENGKGMVLKYLNMDEWRTAYPGNRFEIVLSRDTGSNAMTIADAKAAFVAYTNGSYIHPKIDNGNRLIYTDNVKGTFSNIHGATRNAMVSLLIPVDENSLITFHANYVPAALTAGTKFFRYWEFQTFDASGTVVRNKSITRNNISCRCYIQPGEKYIQINHGIAVYDGTTTPAVVNVLPSDVPYGSFWIECVDAVYLSGWRSIQSAIVKSTAHKGVSNIAPEETAPAYILAKRLGFTAADGDVVLTSDGVPVLLHDLTINRTGRNSDGTSISATTRIDSITYEQALEYDFGVWMGAAFAGTTILSLENFLILCNTIGLKPQIEIKQTFTFSNSDLDNICALIKKYGHANDIHINSGDFSYISYMAAILPGAQFGLLTSTISDTDIANIMTLRATAPDVIIAASYENITQERVNKCITAGVPLRVWTIDNPIPLINLNGYISSVTSNTVNASEWLEDYNMSQLKG